MDDSQLVQHAQSGDRQAFTELVARHQGMLYRRCCRLTGNAGEAEELAHDAFVEAFLQQSSLRDPTRFLPWLYAIARNLFRMRLRRVEPARVELDDALPAVEHGDNPLATRVVLGLSHLSSPHRLVLVLHYLEGLSYDEIAAFLDVPVGTVMSRLHRGRIALKRMVEQMPEEEIALMEDDFTREVDAETAVLLEHFSQDPAAAERLSVLLARSPERFAGMIAGAASDESLCNLALLLRRLGRPAIEVAVQSAVSSVAVEREKATILLQQFIVHLQQHVRGGLVSTYMTPSLPLYLLLDALLRSTANDEVKADLLVALLDAGDDDATTTLLTVMLLSFPIKALPRLLARFWTGENVRVPVLAALARMGTRFVAELLEPLESDDTTRQLRALQGVEAFARSLYSRGGPPDAQNLRSARPVLPKWMPVPPEYVDQDILAVLLERVAALHTDTRADVRDSAIRVLGLLRAMVYRPQLEALTRHRTSSTRMAALRALAELGASESVPIFMVVTETGQPAERLAAVEALGRMGAIEAESVLLARLHDAEATVCRAAVTALGDIGGEAAHAALQQLSAMPDRELARAALLALHTSPHFRRRVPDRTRWREISQQVKAKVHGDVQPRSYISLPAAIAELPEVRPYREAEVTRLIAGACQDYATTRRYLVVDGLMQRTAGIYELTENGKTVWRVERFIRAYYLR